MDLDSDSSVDGDDIATNVLLGYASKDPTIDEFSQLGGTPRWLDGRTAPNGKLAKCLICKGVLSLLLQLDGNLPDWFPGHERKLYILGCRRKACRRKDGSIRALRGVRISPSEENVPQTTETNSTKPATNLGESIFGVKSPTPAQANPFASPSSAGAKNPFSTSSSYTQSTTQPPTSVDVLSATFAQKAKISTAESPAPKEPQEPWPEDPSPYPQYYVDADKEYLDPETDAISSNTRLDSEGGSSNVADEEELFESSMDKTFQRFADRLTQNPEQILRYEFAGQPLLYSKTDKVGKLLAPATEQKIQTSSSHNGNKSSSAFKIPRCASCGAARVFEMQMTPHAITELEAEETDIDGTDWGTIIIGVCSEDCQEKGKAENEVGYVEEWTGVQWEEVVDRK